MTKSQQNYLVYRQSRKIYIGRRTFQWFSWCKENIKFPINIVLASIINPLHLDVCVYNLKYCFQTFLILLPWLPHKLLFCNYQKRFSKKELSVHSIILSTWNITFLPKLWSHQTVCSQHWLFFHSSLKTGCIHHIPHSQCLLLFHILALH